MNLEKKNEELLKEISELNEQLKLYKDKNKISEEEQQLKNKPNQREINSKHNIKNEKSNTLKFYESGRNFYKLFSEEERRAIALLFKNEDDLNNFKEKISIMENKNNEVETKLRNNNKDLLKIINEKDEEIEILKAQIKQNDGDKFDSILKKLNDYEKELKSKNELIEKLQKEIAELKKNKKNNENKVKNIKKIKIIKSSSQDFSEMDQSRDRKINDVIYLSNQKKLYNKIISANDMHNNHYK